MRPGPDESGSQYRRDGWNVPHPGTVMAAGGRGVGGRPGSCPDPGLTAGGGHLKAELSGPSETPVATGCPVGLRVPPAKPHDPAHRSALALHRAEQDGGARR